MRIGKKRGRTLSPSSIDPAAVPKTNLLQSIKNPLLHWTSRASTRLFSLMGVKMITPEISGAAMARLLLDDQLEGVSGKYFQMEKEKRSSVQSYNPQLAVQLWEDSLLLVRGS